MAIERALLVLASCTLATACSAAAGRSTSAPGPVERGRADVSRRGCPACHDPGDGSLAGQMVAVGDTATYGSNLTPDEVTGLGAWSDDQIVATLRTGRDDGGRTLCPSMPRYPALSDDEASDIVDYLRSLAPVANEIPASTCAPQPGDAVDAAVADLTIAVSAPDSAVAPVAVDAAIAGGADAAVAALGDGAVDAGAAASDASDACAPRINEVQTASRDSDADEFVEIVNPCARAAVLDGWRLVYRSSSGTGDTSLATLGGTLAPGAFLVVGGRSYTGTAALRFATGGLASSGGGLALRDGRDAIVDSLGWGSATNLYVRGTAAGAPGAGRSIARHPDGHDSGDNASDLPVGDPTPGASDG